MVIRKPRIHFVNVFLVHCHLSDEHLQVIGSAHPAGKCFRDRLVAEIIQGFILLGEPCKSTVECIFLESVTKGGSPDLSSQFFDTFIAPPGIPFGYSCLLFLRTADK